MDALTLPCLACDKPIQLGTRKVDLCEGCWLLLDHQTRMQVINTWTGRSSAPASFRAALDAAVKAAAKLVIHPIETVETVGGLL